jgi:hypothetical protein
LFKFTLILLFMLLIVQETKPVTVTIPVRGSLAVAIGEGRDKDIAVIDTYTGTVEVLAADHGTLETLRWSPTGERIAYYIYGMGNVILNVNDRSMQMLGSFGGDASEDFYFPGGWSADETTILYKGSSVSTNQITLYLYHLDTQTLTELRSFTEEAPVEGMPLPSDDELYILQDIRYYQPNPVYDKWILLQFDTLAPSDINNDESIHSIALNILWNYDIGAMISLDALFDDPISSLPMEWSRDGQYLLLSTFRQDAKTHIVRFEPNGAVEVIASANISIYRVPMFFVGAGNLILTLGQDDATQEYIFYLSEIIDGEWHETEFIRLDTVNFGTYNFDDWYLRASEEEKKTLSCLFDQTLPPRLELNQRGRVTLTDGTPTRLRAAPGTASQVVTPLAEGTSFDVTASPACADGYRWWQLQLDDGTIGYAAEADTSNYFLEPFDK